jgi:hypothetical protein
LYYFDFGLSQIAGSLVNPAEDTTLTAGHSVSGGGDDFWVEGYRLRSRAAGTAFSSREEPYVRFTPYVLGDRLTKASTAYALRVSYDYTDTLSLVQTYVEDEDNRIAAEDLLVKHFLPGMVRGSVAATGLTQAVGLATIQASVEEVAPDSDLEISDIVGALYTAGATQVTMPLTLVVFHHSQTRAITATIIKDQATANRIQKFTPDPDYLTFTVNE